MRQALPMFALVAFLAAAGPSVAADAPAAPDPHVRKLLDSLDYEYEIDEDGDFRIVFEYDDDKRTQMVYVRTPVETYGAFKVREIWSPAYKAASGETLPVAVANRLLEDSQSRKLGAWVKQGPHAVFVVKLDADASADALRDAMEVAGVTADDLEAELTPGKDDF
jgi:hypothetical protein